MQMCFRSKMIKQYQNGVYGKELLVIEFMGETKQCFVYIYTRFIYYILL